MKTIVVFKQPNKKEVKKTEKEWSICEVSFFKFRIERHLLLSKVCGHMVTCITLYGLIQKF